MAAVRVRRVPALDQGGNDGLRNVLAPNEVWTNLHGPV